MTGALIGAANISAISTGLTATTSGTVTVIAGPVTKLSITTLPSTLTQTGIIFAQQPVIQLQDAAGNPVSQAARDITVSVSTGAGILGGTLTIITNASGVASFTNLMITGVAGDRTLQFSSAGLTGANSGNVSISLTAVPLSVSVQVQVNVGIIGQSTGSVTLSGSGGAGSFTYSKDGITFQSSAVFGSLAAGSYTFTVKDNAGTTSTVNTTISQPGSLAVAVQSQTNVAIAGQSTGSVTLTGSGGAGPYTYSKDGTTFQSSATFSGLTAGINTFIVKDATGVISTILITIAQPSVLVATVSTQSNPTTNGQNTGSITLSGSGGTGPYQYSKDGVTFQVSATFGSLPVGNHTFTVKDAAGAVYLLNTTLVNASSSPSDITFSPVSLYENRASGELAGILSSSSAQSVTTFTYTLVSGTGDTDNARFSISDDGIRTNQMLDYEAKQSYSVRIRSATQFGFSLEKVFTIQLSDVNEAPTLNAIANQMLCYTSSIQVIGLSGVSAGPESGQTTTTTVSSDNPSLFQSLSVVGSEIRYTAALNQSGLATVAVSVQDNGGTVNGGVDKIIRSFIIRVNSLPVISISSSLGNSISKGATTLLTATGGSSYQWSNASGIISGQNGPVLTVRPLQGTSYTVRVMNASGCITTQNVTIQVVDDFIQVNATNNFSPNGDGINDAWVVENIDAYPDHQLTIFDRGGRILYTVRNYGNNWDGRVNGSLLDEGTYFFVFKFNQPGILPKKGFITIVH